MFMCVCVYVYVDVGGVCTGMKEHFSVLVRTMMCGGIKDKGGLLLKAT